MSHCLAHEQMKIFCDNLAVVNALNSGCIRNDFPMVCARTLRAIAAEYDITLIYKHIYGIHYKHAACLSMWAKSKDNHIVRELFQYHWWQISRVVLSRYFYIIVLQDFSWVNGFKNAPTDIETGPRPRTATAYQGKFSFPLVYTKFFKVNFYTFDSVFIFLENLVLLYAKLSVIVQIFCKIL